MWRLNTSLLQEEAYAELITETFQNCKKEEGEILGKWDWFKHKVKEESIKFASAHKRSNDNKLLIFEKKLKQYNEELIEIKNTAQRADKVFTEKQILDQIDRIEIERDRLIEIKLKGARIRARSDLTHFGEKNSKYFYNLEAKNYKRKNRYKIREGKKMITGIKEVLKVQDSFYRKLYNTDRDFSQQDFENFTSNLSRPTLSEEEKQEMEKTFSIIELRKAVFSTKKGKVPGADGLPIEFYQ